MFSITPSKSIERITRIIPPFRRKTQEKRKNANSGAFLRNSRRCYTNRKARIQMQLFKDLIRRYRRFVKFCLVGASGVPVNLFFVWLGNRVLFVNLAEIWRIPCAFALGILISIFSNFLLNDRWTWRDRKQTHHRPFIGRLLRFYFVSSLGAIIQFGTSNTLHQRYGIHYMITPIIGIVLAMVVNYVVNNLWTFALPKRNHTSPESSTTPCHREQENTP